MDTSAMIDGISKTELEHMERIDSDIMERTLSYYHQFDFSTFTSADVQNALQKEQLSALDFAALLSPAAQPLLEQMAQKMASYAYQQQGGAGASDANAGTANAQDDNVVDADFEEKN